MTVKPGAPPVQSDLLGVPPGEGRDSGPPKKRKVAFRRKPSPKPKNPLQDDLFARPLPPRPQPPRTRFSAEELRISVVPAAQFSAKTAPDGWLYLVAEPETASLFVTQGLPLRKNSPLLLAERDGVANWLAKITDNQTELSTTMPVVLRVRRTMVTAWLEPDPDHSAEFSAPCYWLSESRREQD